MNTMRREMETLKIDHIKCLEMKNKIFELKNSVEGLQVDQTPQKKRLQNLKPEQTKTTQAITTKINELSISGMCVNTRSLKCMLSESQEEREDVRKKKYLKNEFFFSNLIRKPNQQVTAAAQQQQRSKNICEPQAKKEGKQHKENTPKHIIMKLWIE